MKIYQVYENSLVCWKWRKNQERPTQPSWSLGWGWAWQQNSPTFNYSTGLHYQLNQFPNICQPIERSKGTHRCISLNWIILSCKVQEVHIGSKKEIKIYGVDLGTTNLRKMRKRNKVQNKLRLSWAKLSHSWPELIWSFVLMSQLTGLDRTLHNQS